MGFIEGGQGGSQRFDQSFDFRSFFFQIVFSKIRNDAMPCLVQPVQLPALGQDLEPAAEGGHSQLDLTCQDTGTACLQMKERGAWTSSGICGLGDPLEELAGAPILPFVESEVCLLQDGGYVLGEGFTDMAAEDAAH
jgi:hypothetical protein